MKARPNEEWPFTADNLSWARRLWDARRDTVEIAHTMGLSEASAHNLVARARDERHAKRQQGGAHA